MARYGVIVAWALIVCLMSGFCMKVYADEELEAPVIPGGSLIDLALSEHVRSSLWPDVNAPQIAVLRKLSQEQSKEFLARYLEPSAEDLADPRGMGDRVRAKYLQELKAALPPDDFTRLQQIQWQSLGLNVVLDPEMVQALGITKEQLEKLGSGEAGLTTSNVNNSGKVERLSPSERGRIMMETYEKKRRWVDEVLTAEQSTKLVKLKGPPFPMMGGGRSIPRFDPPTNLLLLAVHQSVQAELGIAADSVEVATLNQLWQQKRKDKKARIPDPFGVSLAHLNAKEDFRLQKVLNPMQMKRLRQIERQYVGQFFGLSASQVPFLQKVLGLSLEQQQKLDALFREATSKSLALSKDTEVSESERVGIRHKLREQAKQKASDLMTEEQREKFADLEGKPFDIDRLNVEMAEEFPRLNPVEKP